MNGTQIAKAYENLKHSPECPEVRGAYTQFALEIEQQFLTIPVMVEFVEGDAYRTSAEMFADIENNNTLKIWNGGEPHELIADVNLKFRAVHDYFGHYKGRNNFSYEGESKAYKLHSAMFSSLANKALFTETIGQNSWFNFSDENINKPNALRKFAEQKAGLLI